MRRQQLEKLKAELEAELAREQDPSQVKPAVAWYLPTELLGRHESIGLKVLSLLRLG